MDDENQNGMIIEDKSAAISRRRAKFMENLRKAQQAQKAGIMPKSSEKADEETRSKQ